MIIHNSKNVAGKHFIAVPARDGMLEDLSVNQPPIKLYGWGYSGKSLSVKEEGTHFGFVVDGTTKVKTHHAGFDQEFTLSKGMYFCVPSFVFVQGGCGIVISTLNYHGIFMIGGPIEKRGRLGYMDGCSDSLLIPPTKKGDPCLNHLHLPYDISQTRHTHPSIRIGVVTTGKGRCMVPENEDGSGSDMEIPLTPGLIFVIPPGAHHSFFTDDSTLDIVAYHPDSDIGPTDDDHPMINRTFVNGISARNIEEIRTKSITENIMTVGKERTPFESVFSTSTRIETTQAEGAESRQLESVLGKTDFRTQVPSTEIRPYKEICHLSITFQNGKSYTGTGFFIGPKTLITAGHCVFSHPNGGYATQIEVIPGRNGESRPYGSVIARSFYCHPRWSEYSDPNCDIARIDLPDDSLVYSFLPLKILSDSDLRDRKVTLSGYPGDDDKLIGTQWHHSGSTKGLTQHKLEYNLHTSGGQSGSPVLNDELYVVAVHTNGTEQFKHLNSGIRITLEVCDKLDLSGILTSPEPGITG